MKLSGITAVALSCACCLAGGSAFAVDPGQVKVFEATELPLHRYTVVKRIWTQTWRSAFWVSNYDEASDAIAALTSKAADEGANGVINLHCLNDTHGWGGGYFCYGLAIRMK
jgi:hypothetical protein